MTALAQWADGTEDKLRVDVEDAMLCVRGCDRRGGDSRLGSGESIGRIFREVDKWTLGFGRHAFRHPRTVFHGEPQRWSSLGPPN